MSVYEWMHMHIHTVGLDEQLAAVQVLDGERGARQRLAQRQLLLIIKIRACTTRNANVKT